MLLNCGAAENSWEYLGWKEIKQVHTKGNQPWIFIGKIDAKAEAPALWPPDGKSWVTGKDTDAGKHQGQKEKGATEDEMVGWHHWFNWHEFEQTLGDSEGQGSLACCSPWGHKELDTTYWLSNNGGILRESFYGFFIFSYLGVADIWQELRNWMRSQSFNEHRIFGIVLSEGGTSSVCAGVDLGLWR